MRTYFGGRLHDFVVALSFLAVPKDALAEQPPAGAKKSWMSKEDRAKNFAKPWILENECTENIAKHGILKEECNKTLQNLRMFGG